MIILLIFLIVTNSVFAEAQNECLPTSCNASGPIIRYPFRLRGRQPVHCGYPSFDLSCNSNNLTEFDFQFSIWASAGNIILPITARATVQEINYQTQVIRVSFLNGSCLPNRVPSLNATSSPFQMNNQYNVQNDGYTLFNCSGRPEHNYPQSPITCLDSGVFRVYAFPSYYSLGDFPTSNCARMYNISDVSEVIFNWPSRFTVDDTRLHWPEPVCQVCETRGSFCSLRNNETVCVERPTEPQQNNNNGGGLSRNARTAIIIVSVFVAAIVLAAMCRIYLVKKRKRDNEKRTQQFLEDYKALRPSRYTYAEVKKITDGFKHKVGQGGFGTVYKGKLSDDIFVAVKVLINAEGNGEDFINEVKTIGKIHHIHVVRLVGYCADGYKRALVYDFLENDSLEKYLSSGNQSTTLGWEKLHKIAIGISKGIDYLHQGCNQRILHFDIKPQNILLDGNFNPKVADFGLAKLFSKDKSVITMTAARGTVGYIAPEVFSRNFGKVSYKSDMYSFGMLLLDMVGGRKKSDCPNEQNSSSEIYFPEWMYNQLEKGGDIAIDIEKEDESDIMKRLTIVGLWCIQWYPVDRPSAKVVIQMLEGENLPIMPPNPFAATSKSVSTANK